MVCYGMSIYVVNFCNVFIIGFFGVVGVVILEYSDFCWLNSVGVNNFGCNWFGGVLIINFKLEEDKVFGWWYNNVGFMGK